ncbi:hypothetical protein [Lacinutrix sp. MEBiC02404]
MSIVLIDSINNFKKNKMAKNKPIGDNARKGAVKQRSQVLNPKTNLYVKRDTETGKFMDVKTSGGKFKGVRKEK